LVEALMDEGRIGPDCDDEQMVEKAAADLLNEYSENATRCTRRAVSRGISSNDEYLIEHPRPGSLSRAMRPLGRNDQLIRAAVAAAAGCVRSGGAEAVLAQNYPDDRAAPVLLRGATSPASLSSAEWAATLSSSAVSDFVAGLGRSSAASQLVRLGLQLELGRSAAVRVPSVINTAGVAKFIAEGIPIPAADWSSARAR
jgi:hypothetical protein